MYLLWTPLSTHAYAHMYSFTLELHSHSIFLPPTIVSFNLLWTLSFIASPTQHCHPYPHIIHSSLAGHHPALHALGQPFHQLTSHHSPAIQLLQRMHTVILSCVIQHRTPCHSFYVNLSFIPPPATVLLSPTCACPSFPISMDQ